MTVETAADLASFYQTDEFAEAAQWTLAAGGGAVTVDVQLSSPDRDAGLGEPAVRLPEVRVSAQVAQLPLGYGAGDSVVIGAETWVVAEPPELDETRKVVLARLRLGP